MLRLGSTYLKVKDMDKSIEFYSSLLDMKPTAQNFDRWAQFDFHNQCIGLWNPAYDERKIYGDEDIRSLYSQNYIDFFRNETIKHGNQMVLNFYTKDLKAEYDRIKAKNIGEMTPIMFMNVAMPYYLFILYDPDGNEIEITGGYDGKEFTAEVDL